MAKPSLFSEAAFLATSYFITSSSLDQPTYSTTTMDFRKINIKPWYTKFYNNRREVHKKAKNG